MSGDCLSDNFNEISFNSPVKTVKQPKKLVKLSCDVDVLATIPNIIIPQRASPPTDQPTTTNNNKRFHSPQTDSTDTTPILPTMIVENATVYNSQITQLPQINTINKKKFVIPVKTTQTDISTTKGTAFPSLEKKQHRESSPPVEETDILNNDEPVVQTQLVSPVSRSRGAIQSPLLNNKITKCGLFKPPHKKSNNNILPPISTPSQIPKENHESSTVDISSKNNGKWSELPQILPQRDLISVKIVNQSSGGVSVSVSNEKEVSMVSL
jgi:hypothetical protein